VNSGAALPLLRSGCNLAFLFPLSLFLFPFFPLPSASLSLSLCLCPLFSHSPLPVLSGQFRPLTSPAASLSVSLWPPTWLFWIQRASFHQSARSSLARPNKS